MVGGDHRPLVDQKPAQGGHGGVEPTLLADGHPTVGQGPRRGPEQLPVTHRRHQLGVAVAGAEPEELGDGGGAGDTVDGQPDVALELPERRRGQIPEDAVHPPGVESEGAETLLELGDVVTAQHRRPPVEETVPDGAAGLDQGRPGLRSAHPVDPQATTVLERFDGGPGPGLVGTRFVDGGGEAEPPQPLLHIGHRRAGIADLEPDGVRLTHSPAPANDPCDLGIRRSAKGERPAC